MFVLQNKDDPNFVSVLVFENFSLYVNVITIVELINSDVSSSSSYSTFKALSLYNKFSKDETWFGRSEDNKRFFRYIFLNSVIKDALTENDIKNFNKEIVVDDKDPLNLLIESLDLKYTLKKILQLK